ncbi:MAG: aminoacyl-tRNA hydrolase [Candidatus Marinimicrobia bacterium]|nr:aminoacyl-tRNA hydrolase [Candidatus Neomarinimicrobiota bacterium]
MKALVGLGNPGSRYEKTRHNLGFMVMDELAKRWKITFRSGKGDYLQALHSEKDAALIKPLTWMNNSGQAVQTFMNWYKLADEELLVVSDDLDLEFPVMRLRGSGSSGGHKGLDSIIQHISSSNFSRLKLGITNEIRKIQATESFVLSRFNPEEQKELPELIQKAADAVEYYLNQGLKNSMNKYNRKTIIKNNKDQMETK